MTYLMNIFVLRQMIDASRFLGAFSPRWAGTWTGMARCTSRNYLVVSYGGRRGTYSHAHAHCLLNEGAET